MISADAAAVVRRAHDAAQRLPHDTTFEFRAPAAHIRGTGRLGQTGTGRPGQTGTGSRINIRNASKATHGCLVQRIKLS